MRDINFTPIRSIERSVDVLQAFTLNKSKLTLEEVAEVTKIPRSTVYRILCTLENRGMLQYDEEKMVYKPGLKLIELGAFLSSSLDVYQEAEEVLLKLHTEINQTIVMAVGDEVDIIFIFIKENNEGLKFSSVVGQRRPYIYGVLGPVLLAFSKEDKVERILNQTVPKRTPYTITDKEAIRERILYIPKRGIFTEADETTVGVAGVGGPVFDRKGEILAAIGAVGPSIQLNGEKLKKAERLIFEASEEISHKMGYWNDYFNNLI